MQIGATYCHQYQPNITSHAPDNHKETRLKIVYYSIIDKTPTHALFHSTLY